jgi:hypothetical protein
LVEGIVENSSLVRWFHRGWTTALLITIVFLIL